MAEMNGRQGLPSPGGASPNGDGPGPLKRRAVALQYNAGDSAPKVVAEGSGMVAERILELARQHKVPIREDPLLVQTLAKLDVGDAIPPELYFVVAEVFAWLYHLDKQAAGTQRAATTTTNR